MPEQRPAVATSSRVEAIDVARGVALVAMAIYHFSWDLEFFGYTEPGTTAVGGWKFFARGIASSFLFLVGVSLWMAHGRGIRWNGYWKRLAMVAGAAGAISIATYIAVPDAFIFFGILHQIAVASVLGLAFLRLPWVGVLLVAVLVIVLPSLVRSSIFDPAWLAWIGFAQMPPRSNDFVPIFPWFGAVLLGIAAGKLATASGLLARLAIWHPGRWSIPLQFAGRHSLGVYLIHQPVLIAAIYLASIVAPPAVEPPEVGFSSACERQCQEVRDEAFCTRYCSCLLDRFDADGRLAAVLEGTAELDSNYLEGAAAQCTGEAETAMPNRPGLDDD